VVVDPQERDIESYASFAKEKGLKITHVFDTHVHADHRSGGRLLAARLGAAYCLHRSAKVAFPFEPLDDGQQLALGNTIIRVLHTPGHTPESICLLVSDLRRGPEPWFVCTGDTLFVGTVGRPDLPGRTEQSAAELYTSLHQKLLSLPEAIEVYPAHFAGSACGVGMSGKPASTIAFEKRWDTLLSLSADEFIAQVGQDIPPKPAGMEAIMQFNRGESA
jgi:glyoxylase-like metal-dependent hydrolase (beta-lactamase superfamily II)